MQAGSKPELQALVNSLQVSGTGKTVSLSFSLPAEVIETLGAVAAATKGHEGDDDDHDHARPADANGGQFAAGLPVGAPAVLRTAPERALTRPVRVPTLTHVPR